MSGRSILVITRFFPPDREVGAVRVAEWCRHLPEAGWCPAVITRGGGVRGNEARMDPGVEVIHLQSPAGVTPQRPSGLGSSVRRVTRRAKLLVDSLQPFVPDPGIGVWRSAEPRVLEVVERLRPDVVLTTSPPHGIHRLGMAVVQAFPRVSWVADFRDPYLVDARFGPRALGRLRFREHRAFEEAIYRDAALIIHAIPLHYRHARRVYPGARSRLRMLLNGTPEALLEPGGRPGNGRVRIASVGNVDPGETASLIEAVRILVEKGADLELRLTGLEKGLPAAAAGDLGDRLVVRERVSHADAIEEIMGADVLVGLTGSRRSRGLGLSSKLFEYLALPRPSIIVNPTRSDSAFLRSRRGVVLARSPGLSEWTHILEEILEGRVTRPPEDAAAFARMFARREQTRVLAGWLDELPCAWPGRGEGA